MRPTSPVLFLSLVLAFSIDIAAQQADLAGSGMRDRSPQYVPNQLLVRYRPSSAQMSSSQSRSNFAGKIMSSFTSLPGLQLIQLVPGVDFNSALAAYRSDPSVLYAEPNYIRKALDG